MDNQKLINLEGGKTLYEDLRTRIDEHSIPKGGKSGQVLTKTSNNDYAVKWRDPAGSDNEHFVQTNFVLFSGNATESASYATAEGYFTIANADAAHAEGNATQASGYASHAEGYQTEAMLDYSHAEGNRTEATGYASHAEGRQTSAAGTTSHAEGFMTYADAEASHAEGKETEATGSGSHAEGNSTEATGDASHAEGYVAKATGTYSHAEGENTFATGYASHAEGYYTQATGTYSHAEGQGTIASEREAHAAGHNTVASGIGSYAGGSYSGADGDDSFAHGSGLEVYGRDAYAFGKNNIPDNIDYQLWVSGTSYVVGDKVEHADVNGKMRYYRCATANNDSTFNEANWTVVTRFDYIEMIGNGAASNNRKNARTLDWNGNESIAGSLTLGKSTANEATLTPLQVKSLINGYQVTGQNPTIVAQPGVRYVCGQVNYLEIQVPASGCVDVTFQSGQTATTLRVIPQTGQTIKWLNNFDPTNIGTNATYEVNIMDGLGVIGSWT